MKSEDELREMRGTLCDTQFTYSEVCLCYAQLIAKKWYIPREQFIIPSLASEKDINALVKKIDDINVDIPDDDMSDEKDNNEYEVESPPESPEILKKGMKDIVAKSRKIANKKRIPIPWSKEEVNAIKNGIKNFGVGNWAKTRSTYFEIFAVNGRTCHDIYQKFKSLQKSPEFKSFLKKHSK